MSRSSLTGGASAVRRGMWSSHGLDGAGRFPIARRPIIILMINVWARHLTFFSASWRRTNVKRDPNDEPRVCPRRKSANWDRPKKFERQIANGPD